MKPTGGGKRGQVTMLSAASRRRMLHTMRNCESLSIMLTLTYPSEFPRSGKVVKKHWSLFRTWMVRQGRKGAWFLEFQERGAPHIHCFLDGRLDFCQVAERWYKIVGSGDIRHLQAGTRIEVLREAHAATAYAYKYAAKAEQKEVPEDFSEVGRFWGTFGELDTAPVAVAESKEQLLLDMETGEILPDDTVTAIRVTRGLVNARRKSRGLAPIRDNGRRGFTAYDAGPAMAQYLDGPGRPAQPPRGATEEGQPDRGRSEQRSVDAGPVGRNLAPKEGEWRPQGPESERTEASEATRTEEVALGQEALLVGKLGPGGLGAIG